MSSIQEKIDGIIVDGAVGSLTTEKHRKVLNSFINPVGIPPEADLDMFDKTGRYFIEGSDSTKYLNLPFEIFRDMYVGVLNNASIDVYNYSNENTTISEQIFKIFVTANDLGYVEFRRKRYNSTWSEWKLITPINIINDIEYNTGRKFNGDYIFQIYKDFITKNGAYTFLHNFNVKHYLKHQVILGNADFNNDTPTVFPMVDVTGLASTFNPNLNDFLVELTHQGSCILFLEFTKNSVGEKTKQ